MKKIPSFQIDHTRLKKGLYVSRRDFTASGDAITTYDIRTVVPNTGSMSPDAVHTIEHLVASYLRNNDDIAKNVVYFGPMGCLTGFYLILQGSMSSKEVLPIVQDAFEFVANHNGVIPGTREEECGNYKMHSRFGAKIIARNWLDESKGFTKENLIYGEQ